MKRICHVIFMLCICLTTLGGCGSKINIDTTENVEDVDYETQIKEPFEIILEDIGIEKVPENLKIKSTKYSLIPDYIYVDLFFSAEDKKLKASGTVDGDNSSQVEFYSIVLDDDKEEGVHFYWVSDRNDTYRDEGNGLYEFKTEKKIAGGDRKLQPTESSDEDTTQKTGNLLLDSEIDVEPSLSGSGEVIGTWGKYTISKEEISKVTPEQFKEFMDQKVLGTMKGVIDYATIVFGDGTGIHFIPGVNIADYGKISEDGSIIQTYGNIILRDDIYVYESTNS